MHRLVGDRLDLFRIGPGAMFTHDATKKWYFASSNYTLLEAGVQFMITNKCKNLPYVELADFHIRLFDCIDRLAVIHTGRRPNIVR